MRIALQLSYRGTALAGWQRHPGRRTGQGLVEAALVAAQTPARVQAASRTDAGVHARAQVAHVDLPEPVDPRRLATELDRRLPDDLRVLRAAAAPRRFHARWSARGKIYTYVLVLPDDPAAITDDPFLGEHAWTLPDPRSFPEPPPGGRLRLDAMTRALGSLLGRRDFRGLATIRRTPSRRDRTVRTLGAGRILHCPFPGRGGGSLVAVTVSGDAFLKHQVRNLVGLLVEVGYGRIDADSVSALVASRERHQGPRAPGRGLVLQRVRYPAPLDPFRGGA